MSTLNKFNFPLIWKELLQHPKRFNMQRMDDIVKYKVHHHKPKVDSKNTLKDLTQLTISLFKEKVQLSDTLITKIFQLYTKTFDSEAVFKFWKVIVKRNIENTSLKNDLLFHYVYTFQVKQAEALFKYIDPKTPRTLELMARMYSQIPDLSKVAYVLKPILNIHDFLEEPQFNVDLTDVDNKLHAYMNKSQKMIDNTRLSTTGSGHVYSIQSKEFVDKFGTPEMVYYSTYFKNTRYRGMSQPSHQLYRTLLYAYAKNDEPLNVFQVFNWMLQSGKQITADHINILLLCVKDKSLKYSIFSTFYNKVKKNTMTFNVMMMHSKRETQLKLLDDMFNANILPNPITRNIVDHRSDEKLTKLAKLKWHSADKDRAYSQELFDNLNKLN